MVEMKSSLPKSAVILNNFMFIFCSVVVIALIDIGVVYYYHLNILEIEFDQKLADYVRRSEINIILGSADQVDDNNKKIQKREPYSNLNTNLDDLNKSNLDKDNKEDKPCIKLTVRTIY